MLIAKCKMLIVKCLIAKYEMIIANCQMLDSGDQIHTAAALVGPLTIRFGCWQSKLGHVLSSFPRQLIISPGACAVA